MWNIMIRIAEVQHVQRKHENCDVAYEYGILVVRGVALQIRRGHILKLSAIEAYFSWSLEHCLNMYLRKEQYFIYLAPPFFTGLRRPWL